MALVAALAALSTSAAIGAGGAASAPSRLVRVDADGGAGTYTASGSSYDFDLVNTGTTAWQFFTLLAPPGTTFVGGATAGEATVHCAVGQPDGLPNEVECGPLSLSGSPAGHAPPLRRGPSRPHRPAARAVRAPGELDRGHAVHDRRRRHARGCLRSAPARGGDLYRRDRHRRPRARAGSELLDREATALGWGVDDGRRRDSPREDERRARRSARAGHRRGRRCGAQSRRRARSSRRSGARLQGRAVAAADAAARAALVKAGQAARAGCLAAGEARRALLPPPRSPACALRADGAPGRRRSASGCSRRHAPASARTGVAAAGLALRAANGSLAGALAGEHATPAPGRGARTALGRDCVRAASLLASGERRFGIFSDSTGPALAALARARSGLAACSRG